MSSKKDWFIEWFDSRYYHILYQDRDVGEAQFFIDNLIDFLRIRKGKHILDLACGKGRHSIYLNKLGYKVTGADLSINNINYANAFKNSSLDFIVQDMRLPFPLKVDVVFNLFTSFGYFTDEADDIRVLENIKNSLNKNGIVIIDYLNVIKTLQKLIPDEKITLDGVEFHITREVKNNFIIKKIEFEADNEYHNYCERVKCLNLKMFNNFAKKTGFKIKHIFGDYGLNTFNENTSDRLVLVLCNLHQFKN